MRRLAIALAVLWLIVAFAVRLQDMRRPPVYVSAVTGGQQHYQATLAWIEGVMAGRGRLVVADVRIDGKLERFASAGLPEDWPDCRLWLEESDDAVQGVAKCMGHAPVRLTARGTTIAGLGPDNKPPALYRLYPVSSFDPDKIIHKIHRYNLSPVHPVLLLLGLIAMVPLFIVVVRTVRMAQRLAAAPTIEGVMEQAAPGVLTIRSGERRVAVFVERGAVLSVGLARGAVEGGATMAVDGLRASVQGDFDKVEDGVFRGQESVRLRPGAVLVVGDSPKEARRRLLLSAGRDAALAATGVLLSAIVAAGMAW
jgi:hypothetical protein